MELKEFDYYLPKELIAQDPLENRSDSRLMLLDKETGAIEHKIFRDITEYLNPGDCLVINDTKVIPARLYGVRKGTGAEYITGADSSCLMHMQGVIKREHLPIQTIHIVQILAAGL